MNKHVSKMSALLVATIASFLTPFMGSAINIALPTIANEFAADAILLSWVSTSYFLASAIFAVPLGMLADIYGMRKVFTYGMIIITVSSFLAALSPSILSLIFPLERGRAIGINIAVVYIGLSLGPILGGFFTQYFSWRSIFYLVVPLSLMVIALINWKLKGEWAASRGEKFDLLGSILYSLALLMLLVGFSIITKTSGLLIMLLGVIGLVSFIIWELNTESPVCNMELFFKNRMFALSNLAAFISVTATVSVVFLLSLYLQYIKGFNPQYTGLILITQPVVMTFIAPLAGRLSDRFEPGNNSFPRNDIHQHRTVLLHIFRCKYHFEFHNNWSRHPWSWVRIILFP